MTVRDTQWHTSLELLDVLLQLLLDYRLGGVGFPHLVGQLDIGIAELQGNPGCASALRTQWRVLEEVNALALDEGKLEPLKPHLPIAIEAMERIETLIRDAQNSN